MNSSQAGDIWNDLGLSENPYNSLPISSDELGNKLLVGREFELRALITSLTSLNIHPTLEGGNGVGKTSLVSVAGYRLLSAYLSGNGRFVIPLQKNFQLSADENIAALRIKVLLQVVIALLSSYKEISQKQDNLPTEAQLEKWRQALRALPNDHSSPEDNSSSELARAVDEITTWLEKNFSSPSSGFFLCVIDNLELLETSSEARLLLEEMRDEILNIPGLRWVLCGARGIVRSVASTGRLVGFLGDPIEVLPVKDEYIGELIDVRLNAFKNSAEISAPVEPDGFLKLYHIGNKNLRITMKYCQDFTVWAYLEGRTFSKDVSKIELLESWLSMTANKILEDASVGKRAWAVFDLLAKKGGSMKPNNYPDFGFKSYPAMVKHLQSLANANLVESIVDNTDARKKTISILPLGWVVNYQRQKSALWGNELA